jgi:hypothetical protein
MKKATSNALVAAGKRFLTFVVLSRYLKLKQVVSAKVKRTKVMELLLQLQIMLLRLRMN